VAKHVLDVLGTDVAGGHHLDHRVARGLLAEQLDEEDQPHRLALHGATAAAKILKYSTPVLSRPMRPHGSAPAAARGLILSSPSRCDGCSMSR